ncbi:MAG: hypothetical protein Udaeo2_30490 [Candidatus Udaeobacter sp.]|nr:MAG: hypothetical protein Udaeo2_30490 [Candidatus Udaeobacter sp.]
MGEADDLELFRLRGPLRIALQESVRGTVLEGAAKGELRTPRKGFASKSELVEYCTFGNCFWVRK